VEPLDKEADARNNPINSRDAADKDPVDDTDEHFETASVVYVHKRVVGVQMFFPV
jgi:hypothetical protein